jgi:hypothetical protein
MAAKKPPVSPTARVKPAAASPTARAAPPTARATPSPTARASVAPAAPALEKPRFETIEPDVPPPPKRGTRSALRALVPSSYRAEGEAHPFLRDYKTKWLSRLDFASDTNVQSLLVLSFMVLTEGRDAEAEAIADILVKHVDLKRMNQETRQAITAALFLTSYLKAKRGADASAQLSRARALAKYFTERDREWLSSEASHELADAVQRGKSTYLLDPFYGIARWLTEPSAKHKAEQMLAEALAATRKLMK